MYSLQIRFKLLNKSCNRQELSDNLNIGSISIMSDEQSPFSVIIQGYRSEEEAQKTVDEIRAGNVIIPPKGSKENPFIQIPGNMPDDFIIVEKHNPQNTYSFTVNRSILAVRMFRYMSAPFRLLFFLPTAFRNFNNSFKSIEVKSLLFTNVDIFRDVNMAGTPFVAAVRTGFVGKKVLRKFYTAMVTKSCDFNLCHYFSP